MRFVSVSTNAFTPNGRNLENKKKLKEVIIQIQTFFKNRILNGVPFDGMCDIDRGRDKRRRWKESRVFDCFRKPPVFGFETNEVFKRKEVWRKMRLRAK